MTRAIQQSVVLKAPPDELFEMFLDSKKHAAVTGAPAKISRKVGGTFTAHGGHLQGRTLMIVPNRLIVQAWRATQWKAEDADSILVVGFSEAPGGGRIDLVHINVPAYDHAGVTEGWKKYYWTPWKAYLGKKG